MDIIIRLLLADLSYALCWFRISITTTLSKFQETQEKSCSMSRSVNKQESPADVLE